MESNWKKKTGLESLLKSKVNTHCTSSDFAMENYEIVN